MDKEKQVLRDYISQNKLKFTEQRELILEVFLSTKSHVTAEELYQIVSKQYPMIGLATVYRTLNLLSECGLVQQRQFGDGQARYELVHEHHDHLICTKCRKIIEFENEKIEQLQEQIAEQHGFVIQTHKHELYGICSDCQDKDTKGFNNQEKQDLFMY
jgi:Fur family ferric uptake transcriptional regulator